MVRHGMGWRSVAAAVVMLAAPGSVAAQVVTGHVLESETSRPVMLARVALLDTTYTVVDETLSEEDGRFTLQAPAPGDYYVLADRVGYQPRLDGILELGQDGYINVEFYLPAQAIELEGITATARRQIERRHLERQGFFQRQEMGLGHHIGPEEIRERPPFDLADLLRGIPRVQVVGDGLGGSTVVFRGGIQGTCEPRIMVDGIEVIGGSIEGAMAVEDIIAVEVYAGVASAPMEYSGLNNCGVLLIWTG